MHGAEVLIPLIMFAGGFAMIFGIVYLKTRQNLAMIEKGMNPKEFANRPAPYKNLKWALLLIGAGIGLFLAYLLDNYVYAACNSHDMMEHIVRYLFCPDRYRRRTGTVWSHRMEKKW